MDGLPSPKWASVIPPPSFKPECEFALRTAAVSVQIRTRRVERWRVEWSHCHGSQIWGLHPIQISGLEITFFRFSAGFSRRSRVFILGAQLQLNGTQLDNRERMDCPMNVRKRKRLALTRKRTRLEASQARCSRLAGMRTTASLRMVPKTDWRFFKRRRDIHSKAGQLLVNSVADKLRFVGDSAGVQTFLQRPLKLRIHWEGDQLLIWRPFIRHECIKSICILL